MLSQNSNGKLYYSLDDEMVSIPSPKLISEEPIHITNVKKSIDFIPGMRSLGGVVQLFPEGRILEAGNFKAYNSGFSYPISFNYSSSESKLDCFSKDEIDDQINRIGAQNIKALSGKNINIQAEILSTKNQKELWKIFVLLAIMFLVIEVFLLRFLK